MRIFAHVVIEQQRGGQWWAWFSDTQDLIACGQGPADALRRLLILSGAQKFEISEMFPVLDATTRTHMEFRIPRRSLQVIPRPSAN